MDGWVVCGCVLVNDWLPFTRLLAFSSDRRCGVVVPLWYAGEGMTGRSTVVDVVLACLTSRGIRRGDPIVSKVFAVDCGQLTPASAASGPAGEHVVGRLGVSVGEVALDLCVGLVARLFVVWFGMGIMDLGDSFDDSDCVVDDRETGCCRFSVGDGEYDRSSVSLQVLQIEIIDSVIKTIIGIVGRTKINSGLLEAYAMQNHRDW